MSEKEWQAQVDCLLKEVNEYGAEGLLCYEQGILWAAGRIRELEAEVVETQEVARAFEQNADTAETKLRAVAELPRRCRQTRGTRDEVATAHRIADELEALLKNTATPGSVTP